MWTRPSFTSLDFWQKLGVVGSVASIVALMLTVAVYFSTPAYDPPPDISPPSDMESDGTWIQVQALEEPSALSVINALQNSHNSERVFNDLFRGRSIRPPGWAAVVQEHPSRSGEEWELKLIESYTGVSISLRGMGKSVSRMRKYDSVLIHGGVLETATTAGYARLEVRGGIVNRQGKLNFWSYNWRAFWRPALVSMIKSRWFILWLIVMAFCCAPVRRIFVR